jgi:hypothetical protein
MTYANRLVSRRKQPVGHRIPEEASKADTGEPQRINTTSVRVYQHATNATRQKNKTAPKRRLPPFGKELPPRGVSRDALA